MEVKGILELRFCGLNFLKFTLFLQAQNATQNKYSLNNVIKNLYPKFCIDRPT